MAKQGAATTATGEHVDLLTGALLRLPRRRQPRATTSLTLGGRHYCGINPCEIVVRKRDMAGSDPKHQAHMRWFVATIEFAVMALGPGLSPLTTWVAPTLWTLALVGVRQIGRFSGEVRARCWGRWRRCACVGDGRHPNDACRAPGSASVQAGKAPSSRARMAANRPTQRPIVNATSLSMG